MKQEELVKAIDHIQISHDMEDRLLQSALSYIDKSEYRNRKGMDSDIKGRMVYFIRLNKNRNRYLKMIIGGIGVVFAAIFIILGSNLLLSNKRTSDNINLSQTGQDFWLQNNVDASNQIKSVQFFQMSKNEMNRYGGKKLESNQNEKEIEAIYNIFSKLSTKNPLKQYSIDGYQLVEPSIQFVLEGDQVITVEWNLSKGTMVYNNSTYYIEKEDAEDLYELFKTYNDYWGQPLASTTSYDEALTYISQNQYIKAYKILNEIKGSQEAEALIEQIRYRMNASYIDASQFSVGAILDDGTVAHVSSQSSSSEFLDTSTWNEIKEISVAGEGLDALTSDGRFLTSCPRKTNVYGVDIASEYSELNNLSSFSSAYPNQCIGITNNGEIRFVSSYCEKEGFEGWDNMVEVVSAVDTAYGLTNKGTVKFNGMNRYDKGFYDEEFQNIVSIKLSGPHVVALTEEGTVLTNNPDIDTSKLKDVIAIAASSTAISALHPDGTVETIGDNQYEQSWDHIVAIKMTESYILGLKEDGTLVTTSGEDIPDVSNITGVYVPEVVQ